MSSSASTMSGIESLERLKGLHRDLVDLTEARLPNIERLLAELEAHIGELRSLLDRPRKNDKSRQALLSGSKCPCRANPTPDPS